MKAGRGLTLSLVVIAAGAVLLASAYVLPLVKTPQTMVSTGPTNGYGNGESTISGYFIPPVDEGEQVSITLSGFKPGSLSFSFFPSSSDSLSPEGTPLMVETSLSPTFQANLTSPATQAYGVYVTSENRTAFTLTVQSVWSPFFPLRGYVAVAFFLLIAGGFGALYFHQAKAKEEQYEKALEELRARQAGQPANARASGAAVRARTSR